MDEWKLFALDPYVGEIINSRGQLTQHEPKIDVFWCKVHQMKSATGQAKYPLLENLTKACLALAHGNADTERSF